MQWQYRRFTLVQCMISQQYTWSVESQVVFLYQVCIYIYIYGAFIACLYNRYSSWVNKQYSITAKRNTTGLVVVVWVCWFLQIKIYDSNTINKSELNVLLSFKSVIFIFKMSKSLFLILCGTQLFNDMEVFFFKMIFFCISLFYNREIITNDL